MDLEGLVVKHAGWIRLKARQFIPGRYDADDLASETIYRCLSNARRYDGGMSFKPWALTIMTNIFVNWYNRRRCVLFTGLDGHDLIAEGYRADQRAAVSDMMEIIGECARKSCCIECVMLYAEGYTHAEIAVMSGIPAGTVKSRISAGRKMLRKMLGY